MSAPKDLLSDALGSTPSTPSASCAKRSRLLSSFDRFASAVTRWAGSPLAFALALLSVLVWAALGYLFDYSENWQLVINTGTTIVTFLMVFMIQQTQNKDTTALHLKLNELLAASKHASNRMIGIEALDEQELRDVAEFYVRLASRAKDGGTHKESHSIDEEGMPTDKRGSDRPVDPTHDERHEPNGATDGPFESQRQRSVRAARTAQRGG